jgi:hypothetical protein
MSLQVLWLVLPPLPPEPDPDEIAAKTCPGCGVSIDDGVARRARQNSSSSWANSPCTVRGGAPNGFRARCETNDSAKLPICSAKKQRGTVGLTRCETRPPAPSQAHHRALKYSWPHGGVVAPVGLRPAGGTPSRSRLDAARDGAAPPTSRARRMPWSRRQGNHAGVFLPRIGVGARTYARGAVERPPYPAPPAVTT